MNNTKISKNKKIEVVAVTALLVITIAAITYGIIDMIRFPESYDSVAKYHMMYDIENGDTAAIERYRSVYIENDKVLFDGPITISMYCDFKGLNRDLVEKSFEDAKASYIVNSFQEYIDKFLK